MNSISLGNHPMMDPPLFKKISDYVFNFDELLGEGSFSKVYKGHHQPTGQSCAVKVVQLSTIRTTTLEKLLVSQIEVLKHLNHPNTLKCYEVLCSQRNCYIISEFCNEGTLQSKLRREGPFSEIKAQSIIKDIFEGLKYLGELGIVHRDLKVANIFLNNGIAKIADFGFANFSKDNFKDANIGSPLYMSPEGYINNCYGPKTDVWSFGILIYQLFHGFPPFAGSNTESDLFYAMTVGLRPQQLKKDLSQDIKQVILNCLQIDQKKRPTINELSFMPYFERIFHKKKQYKQPNQQETIHQNRLYVTDKNSLNINKNRYNSLASKQSTVDEYFSAHRKIKSQKLIIEKVGDQHRSKIHSTIQINLKPDKLCQQSNQGREEKKMVGVTFNSDQSNFKIFMGRLSFAECVSSLHYGRTLFKFLILFKETFSEQDPSVLFTLTKWLLQLLTQIRLKIMRQEVNYPANPITYQEKLLQVCQEYRKQYSLALSTYIIQSNYFKDQGYSLDYIKYFCLGIFQKIDPAITSKSSLKIILMGQLIVLICDFTKLLSHCYTKRDNRQLENYREAQQFLRDYREKNKLVILYEGPGQTESLLIQQPLIDICRYLIKFQIIALKKYLKKFLDISTQTVKLDFLIIFFYTTAQA